LLGLSSQESSFSFSFLLVFGKGACLLFVLFTDLVEFLHVLKEVGASLEGDE
jgi:hypothetical protein